MHDSSLNSEQTCSNISHKIKQLININLEIAHGR